MQTQIHPTWYPEAKVTCACGNTFTLGSTKPEIEVEVCYNCHPFYTGQMKLLDTAGRVDSFRARQKSAQKGHLSKKERRKAKLEKRLSEEFSRPESLADLKKLAKKTKKAKKTS